MPPAAIIALITRHQILDTDLPLLPESDLFTLGLDSLAVMQLLLALEAEAGRPLPQAEVSRDHLRTPAAISAWLAGLG